MTTREGGGDRDDTLEEEIDAADLERLRNELRGEREKRRKLADVIFEVSKCVGPCDLADLASKVREAVSAPRRERLPDERDSITHKFSIAGYEGYVTAGKYPDGRLGEMFLKMAKEGSTISGLMDAFATVVSLALQYGVPLRVLCDKLQFTRFEPAGFTNNPEIPRASSTLDYLFHWLRAKFLPDEPAATPEATAPETTAPEAPEAPEAAVDPQGQAK